MFYGESGGSGSGSGSGSGGTFGGWLHETTWPAILSVGICMLVAGFLLYLFLKKGNHKHSVASRLSSHLHRVHVPSFKRSGRSFGSTG